MKRVLLLTVIMLSFVSCDKEVKKYRYENTSGSVLIYVKDANGNNLLDPDFEGNILNTDIYAEYKKEIYSVYNHPFYFPRTRVADPPHWWGLVYMLPDGSERLHFGDFITTRDREFHGETFTINWGDGTSDEIKFDLYVAWEGEEHYSEPIDVRKIWLNGELQSDNSLWIEIVK